MNLRAEYKAYLNSQLSSVASYVPFASMLQEQWNGMVWPASDGALKNPKTGLAREVLEEVGRASVTVPEHFVRH